MNPFARSQPKESTVQQPQLPKISRFQQVIVYLNAAHDNLTAAMQMFNTLNLDLQKADDFVARFRDGLIRAIEGNGGEIIPQSVIQQSTDQQSEELATAIETAVHREYAPKYIREAPPPRESE
jgi:hypothetical protein